MVLFTDSNCSSGASEVIIFDDDRQYLSELYNGFDDNVEICSIANEESDSTIEYVW